MVSPIQGPIGPLPTPPQRSEEIPADLVAQLKAPLSRLVETLRQLREDPLLAENGATLERISQEIQELDLISNKAMNLV